MTENDLSKNLWQIANLLTGFVVVQAIAFIYACADKEFAHLINTRSMKLAIAIHVIVITLAESYAVWWCGDRSVSLVKNGRQPGAPVDPKRQLIAKIIKRVTLGRVIVILSLLIPSLLSLYARQLSGKPFNP